VNFKAPISLKNYLSVPHSADQPHRGRSRRGGRRTRQAKAEAQHRAHHARFPRDAFRGAAGAGHNHDAIAACALFADAFGLATSPAPIGLPTLTISLLWHASYDHDPGHVWLRQIVSGLASEVGPQL
jgi:hypothetical protein